MSASIAFVTERKHSFHNARMTSELWQRLVAARKRAKLTQQDVADEFGISRVAVSQWEAADPLKRTSPEHSRLAGLSRITGHPLWWLMDDSVDPAVPPISSPDATITQTSPPRLPRVQVRGTALMDKEGFWTELVDDPEGNGYFSVVTDDPGAYFVRIRGGDIAVAMSGSYVLLLPGITPEPGMHVLVKLKDGRSTIRELVSNMGGEYRLQASDGTRMLLAEGDVEYMHFVAGTMMPGLLKR